MAGIGTVRATVTTIFSWLAANTPGAGVVYNPISNPLTVQKQYQLGTQVTNTLAGGADEVYSFQQTIAGGGSATFDLFSLTNAIGQLAPMVRLKALQIRLLSAADDPTIVPAPTATSQIVVTNQGVTAPVSLDFGVVGSGLVLNLTTALGVVTAVTISTAGSGYPPNFTFLTSVAYSPGAGLVVAVTTNASGVPTTATLLSGGTGYAPGTVPAVPLGAYGLYTGGAHMHFDLNPLGFSAVSASSRNMVIVNTDSLNPVTPELDFIGASS